MRLVKITGPKGRGADIAKIAFECGISDVSIHTVEQHKPGVKPAMKEAVDMKVSTPEGRAVIEAVVRAPFYNRDEYAIDIREPRSILKSTSVRDITRPVAPPIMDIDQELWQFSHVTYSFVLRVIIASLLLAYGMIHDNPLLMIGGLVFLPLMPLVLGFGYGVLAREWKLVAQSAAAFVTATLLTIVAAAVVAMFAEPPMMFDKFPPMAAGALFSLAVGIAAALATADDAGHRQLVGLAAASQLALVPAWLGISIVFGFSESAAEKLTGFAFNTVCLVLGAAAVYGVLLWRAQHVEGALGAHREYKH
jgi:hypothetical protein